jgi:hypothetical protein
VAACSAVFSGAGISIQAPASLPGGFAVRNDVLRVVHEHAASDVPDLITNDQLDALLDSGRKLEVILGRLWGTVGDDALGCLLALHVDVPNEAHLLSALHLATGGVHLTVNLDVGIERAYELLTGAATLPSATPVQYARALPAWQALVPRDVPPLRVVASRPEFDAWVADDRPAALLKVHGSLDTAQRSLVDVVVIDIDELGQLHDSRRAAVDTAADAVRLLITAYSGADPDVYEPLLAAATHTYAMWRCISLPSGSPVTDDCAARSIDLRVGTPDSSATVALRELLGLGPTPNWPQVVLNGETYTDRFRRWADQFVQCHAAESMAQAWAWLAADLGDLDSAYTILDRLCQRGNPPPGLRFRLAEVLYTRARGNDRDQALAIYRSIARRRDIERSTRNQCVLRISDVARGRAIRGRGGPRSVLDLVHAISGPLRVLVGTRGGRVDRESAADAYRALQQTGLRTTEHVAAATPRAVWPILAVGCRWLTRFGRRAEELAQNGNRRALIRQQRLLLTALASLLSRRPVADELATALRVLHEAYRNADDIAGAGNCTAALAVVAAANHDISTARTLLDTAWDEYLDGRAEPIAAGVALVTVLRRIVNRA